MKALPGNFKDFLITERVIELIRMMQIARAKNKKKINLFTVNEKDEMVRFINAGVNGLITDYPQRLASLVNEDFIFYEVSDIDITVPGYPPELPEIVKYLKNR